MLYTDLIKPMALHNLCYLDCNGIIYQEVDKNEENDKMNSSVVVCTAGRMCVHMYFTTFGGNC